MFPIIAGSETTATAIKMIVSFIASNPTVASRLKEEIEEARSAGRLSSPVTYAEASELPYLKAVIWEGMRMHPPFGGLIMKQVGPDGDIYNGTFIPPGTRIGHSTWAVMRDRAVFGADVDSFRPERWLEADEKRRNIMQKQADLVFGSGRWGCPGRVVASMEISKVVVEVSSLACMKPERKTNSCYSCSEDSSFNSLQEVARSSKTRRSISWMVVHR